ncbi:MAG: hypothetical protein QXS93_01040 [Candidatus Micrarchaeia archaeon]
MVESNTKKPGLLAKLKKLFARDDAKEASGAASDRTKTLNQMKADADTLIQKRQTDVEEAYNTVPSSINSKDSWGRSFSGIHEIYRKHTPFGIVKTNGREIEIEHFDLSLLELIKQHKLIPLFENINNHSIIGYYEINIATLRVSNAHKFTKEGKEHAFGILRASISKSAYEGRMSEKDLLEIDTLMLKLEKYKK